MQHYLNFSNYGLNKNIYIFLFPTIFIFLVWSQENIGFLLDGWGCNGDSSWCVV